MSWLTDSSSNAWSFRQQIMLDRASITPGATSNDYQVVIDPTWADFWDNVQDTTNGHDIVVTDADGLTVEAYDFTGFNHTNRTLTINVDAAGIDGDQHTQTPLWLYWGKTSPSNQTTATTISSAETGYVYLGSVPQDDRLVSSGRWTPGASKARQEIAFAAGDDRFVWWRIDQYLPKRASKSGGRRELVELHDAVFEVSTGGSPNTALTDKAEMRFVRAPTGRQYVRTLVKDLSAGTDYLLKLTITTTESEVIELRAVAVCTNPDES